MDQIKYSKEVSQLQSVSRCYDEKSQAFTVVAEIIKNVLLDHKVTFHSSDASNLEEDVAGKRVLLIGGSSPMPIISCAKNFILFAVLYQQQVGLAARAAR